MRNLHPLNYIVIITASGPRTGKTTVMNYICRQTELFGCSTSDIVIQEYIKKLGPSSKLTLNQIKNERLKNPEKYRKELIEVGAWLNDQSIYPSSLAVDMGYRVIEGARISDEVIYAKLNAHSKKLTCRHLHIRSDRSDVKDSTKPDLINWADIVIDNNGTLEELCDKVDKVVFE